MESIKNTRLYRAGSFFIRKYKEHRLTSRWVARSEDLNENIKKLLALKDKHKNQPCVVIGNGPSLKKMNLNDFKDMVTIACNAFYLVHDKLDFIPTYYSAEDLFTAENNAEALNNLKGTTKIIPYDLKGILKPSENTVYVNFLRTYMRSRKPDFPLFSRDFENKAYWGGSVVYMNLQLAYFLGCNPIYLIGVDMSYNVPDKINKTSGPIAYSAEIASNYFTANYLATGQKWNLPEVWRLQKSFAKAYHELRKEGVELINIGIDSKLEVVPKREFIK